MQPKASFYFVLYLIGIVSLLAVINERDFALDSLMKDYETPLQVSAASVNEFVIATSDTLDVYVANLKTNDERRSIRYHLQSLNDNTELEATPIVDPTTGNARFVGNFSQSGEFHYKVWADVIRHLPKDAGGHRVRTGSDTATFAVLVSTKKSEIPGTKFSMGVDKKSEHWISGVPYMKTIFVNTDPRKVQLFGLPAGFRRGAITDNSLELIWDMPTPGNARIALNGNAGRSLSTALDAASLNFTVNVEPPVWNPPPQKTAYWNIAYNFGSKVGELDENDFTISVIANGSIPVPTDSHLPITILPEKTWTSLTFIAATRSGREMLRSEIPVKTPPPPQIKWTSSRLQGDDYVISFSAEDVGGKDVNVNCTLVQPTGLNAVLSARHGKAFTFTVKNVSATRPQALVVRTSIHGIGGTSTPLDRTFPILY